MQSRLPAQRAASIQILAQPRYGQQMRRPSGRTLKPPRQWPLAHGRTSSRPLHVHVGSLLLPPLALAGLVGALWLHKCLAMILFQNRIIYRPGVPPNARSDKINDYAADCALLQWEEQRIRAADGTELALAVTTLPAVAPRPASDHDPIVGHAYILYFQGQLCPNIAATSAASAHRCQEMLHPYLRGWPTCPRCCERLAAMVLCRSAVSAAPWCA